MEEQRHKTFLNLLLKVKLRKSVQFVFGRKKGGVFQPEKLAEYHKSTINETAASFLEGEHLREKIPSCATVDLASVDLASGLLRG